MLPTRRSSLALTLLLMASSSSQASGLQSEMNSLFNGMSNVTQPGVYESQRRGVLSGGRVSVKTRIVNENIVSLVPPSWKAGCGGVDLFGGSFSFINAEQLVQLLRAVAANAKGYAFQLALDNVFPDGAKWIEAFQKKIQELNQHLGNSCQLAQGIVNDVGSAFNLKGQNDASITATANGFFEDFFGSRQEPDGKGALATLKEKKPDEYQHMIGNIVWRQLNSNNVKAWFSYGDDALLEAIMSLTGTVIIQELEDDSNAQATGSNTPQTTPITTLPGNKIGLAELINGGSGIEIYSCARDKDNCLTAGQVGSGIARIDLAGIKQQIIDTLLGTPSSIGIIDKYAYNSAILTDAEKAFVANLPVGAGAIVRNLAILSRDSAQIFVTESAGSLALAMTYGFTEEFFRAARVAIANSKSPYIKNLSDLFQQSQAHIRREYGLLSAEYGDLSQSIERYNNLLTNVRKQQYLLNTMVDKQH